MYHLPGRVCNYALKHHEIDTPKITKIRHSEISVLIFFKLSPLKLDRFQQFRAQNLSWSVHYWNKKNLFIEQKPLALWLIKGLNFFGHPLDLLYTFRETVLQTTTSNYVQNMTENMILGLVMSSPKLRRICCKRSIDVTQQADTPGKSTIFVLW